MFGTGRDIESLENTQSHFTNFIPIQADFTRNEDIERVAVTIKKFGTPVYLSVQNAGMKSLLVL